MWPVTSWTLDDWYWALQVGSAVTALFAFAFLVGTVRLGRLVNQRDSGRLVSLETDLTNAKLALSKQEKETADAKIALAEVMRKQGPRIIDAGNFALALKGRERYKAIVESVLTPGFSTEPHGLAAQFWAALHNAGWDVGNVVVFIEPTSPDASWVRSSGASMTFPPSVSVLNRPPEGVAVLTRSINPRTKPLDVLSAALETLSFGVGLGIDQDMPADVVRIVIGPKP